MSKRKRQARRAKRKRAVERRLRAEGATQSPAVQEVTDSFERFARYVRSADSPDAAAVRADLRELADDIIRLACGLDLIKVVSSVRVGMIMSHSTTGVEPSAAALELIALALTCRDSAPSEDRVEPRESRFMPPHLDAVAREVLSVGSLIALFETPASDPEHTVLFHSVQREINLRNPVYPEMLLETLLGLFSDPAVNDDCRAVLGFSGLEAVNVMEAVRSLTVSGLEQRFSHMDAARDASLPHLESLHRAGRDPTEDPDPVLISAVQEVVNAVHELTANISQATVIDPGAVAARTGYEPSVVEAVLDVFTFTESLEMGEMFQRFFRGDNPLRTAPIVSDPQGRRMVVHDGLALPAVREVIETRLKAANRNAAYEKYRGDWVEKAAIDLLEKALLGGRVFRAFNYFVPDPRAAVPQVEPREFTKRVEGDGLIVIDDIALIVEVKSVALTAEARGGVVRRLRGKLRDIVTNAANQAARLRERIITDKRIRLDDDQWIDVSGVREIHTVAVGLEDLSGVTTATPALIAAGVLKQENIPWTVSLHDLRIVCEILDRPSELVLYLRRRTQPETTWKYRAVDELDLFLLFLKGAFYFEPDPRQLAEALPWSALPSTGDMRRYTNQHPQLVSSQTRPLDDWYEAKRGPDARTADKPRFVGDQRLLRLVDMIAAT